MPPKPPVAVLKVDCTGSAVPDKGQEEVKAKVEPEQAALQARMQAQAAAEANQHNQAMEARARLLVHITQLVSDWTLAHSNAQVPGKYWDQYTMARKLHM